MTEDEQRNIILADYMRYRESNQRCRCKPSNSSKSRQLCVLVNDIALPAGITPLLLMTSAIRPGRRPKPMRLTSECACSWESQKKSVQNGNASIHVTESRRSIMIRVLIGQGIYARIVGRLEERARRQGGNSSNTGLAGD